MACIGCYTENEASWNAIDDRYERLDQVQATIKRSDLDQTIILDLKIFATQMQSNLDLIKDHWENVHCDGTSSAFCEIQDQQLEMFDKWYRSYLKYLKDHQIKSKDWENRTHQILNDRWNEPVRKTLNLLTVINGSTNYLEAILKTNPQMENHRVWLVINTKSSFDDQQALAIINQEISQLVTYLITNVEQFLDYSKATFYDWKIKLEWWLEWNQNQVPMIYVWLKTSEDHNCPLVGQSENSQLILTNHKGVNKGTRLLSFINEDWWKYPVLIDQDLKTQLVNASSQWVSNSLGFSNDHYNQVQKVIKQCQNLRFKFPMVLKLINDKSYLCFAKDWLVKNLVIHYDAKMQNLWKLAINSQSEYGFAASEIDQHQLDQISANSKWIWDHQGWSLSANHFKMIETISKDN